MPDMRAQNDLFLAPPPGCGALRLEPVARLYLALPLAVRPLCDSFHLFRETGLLPFVFFLPFFLSLAKSAPVILSRGGATLAIFI